MDGYCSYKLNSCYDMLLSFINLIHITFLLQCVVDVLNMTLAPFTTPSNVEYFLAHNSINIFVFT